MCDIQNPVAFLFTNLLHPDEDDWGNLKRLMKYIGGGYYLKLEMD